MPKNAILCLGLCLAAGVAMNSVVTEDTASANALSGITLLSSSVADLGLSPTIPKTGFALSYNIPFSSTGCGVYSLNTGTRLGSFIASAGASYMEQEDYRWQDIHLGLAWHYKDLAAGYSQHLIYEKFSNDMSYHTWTGNLGLSYRRLDYGGEIRLIHLGQDDAELHLSASSLVVEGVYGSSSYVYAPNSDDSFRFATSIRVSGPFQLQASWQNTPPRFGGGLKFSHADWEIMYAIRSHAELSLTHALDLGYNW